jgi:hypothetical protein
MPSKRLADNAKAEQEQAENSHKYGHSPALGKQKGTATSTQ